MYVQSSKQIYFCFAETSKQLSRGYVFIFRWEMSERAADLTSELENIIRNGKCDCVKKEEINNFSCPQVFLKLSRVMTPIVVLELKTFYPAS